VSAEFRVRWQREGRSPTSRIYQTETAARRKIDSILALEEIKGDTRQWADMPDLVGPPELQVRDVSEWRAAEPSAQDAPSEAALAGVAQWAGVNDDPYGVF
jgi:hypothetical protein